MIGSATTASIFQPVQSVLQANASAKQTDSNELTESEEKQVQELKKRDQEVRTHEQSHKTIAGPYAGEIQYETQTGPDGKEYAVGGEVSIDASPVKGDPEATIRKMDIVIRAALAPAEPSPQDRAVASQAQAQRTEAQAELNEDAQKSDVEENEKSFIETLIDEQTSADHQRASSAYGNASSAQIAQATASILSAIAV
ncbi:MAG: hypothetical protein COB76_00060 [Alphaproteobacteria bacterium]|nr:MAG: hypothetical protein COB76_00060 [Alphaproteobacteria bacterium]